MPPPPKASPEAELTPAELRRAVRDKALAYLARREHSAFELRDKLSRNMTRDEKMLREVLQELAAADAQSDRRFAAQLCRVRIARGKGPLHVRRELQHHRIHDDIIARVIAEHDAEWSPLAEQVRQKKFGDAAADFEEWARQARFLRARGFAPAQIGRFDGDETVHE